MIISILIGAICVLLIGAIFIQNSKGGGIQSKFSEVYQIIGVKKGTELIEKFTWVMAIGLFFISLVIFH